jgi:hypothetical protein
VNLLREISELLDGLWYPALGCVEKPYKSFRAGDRSARSRCDEPHPSSSEEESVGYTGRELADENFARWQRFYRKGMIDRRTFVKAAMIWAGAAAGGSILAACGGDDDDDGGSNGASTSVSGVGTGSTATTSSDSAPTTSGAAPTTSGAAATTSGGAAE